MMVVAGWEQGLALHRGRHCCVTCCAHRAVGERTRCCCWPQAQGSTAGRLRTRPTRTRCRCPRPPTRGWLHPGAGTISPAQPEPVTASTQSHTVLTGSGPPPHMHQDPPPMRGCPLHALACPGAAARVDSRAGRASRAALLHLRGVPCLAGVHAWGSSPETPKGVGRPCAGPPACLLVEPAVPTCSCRR